MNDTPTPQSAAASLLAPVFLDILREDGVCFESFETRAIAVGHAVIADAMAAAIERLDAELCSNLPEGCRVHDRRRKTLATEVGDLSFAYRRVRDAFGGTVVPCADALDLPWNARVSPSARAFLVEAGAETSYQRAANLLARNGSRVSATTVMNSLRQAGELCAEEDAALAGYLRGNIDLIAAEGPSLGTMESENQHLYGARMDSVPCAWSREGASAMARIVSRRASGRAVPRMTREKSASRRRIRRSEERAARALFPKGAGKVLESVGKGYLPPHQASVAGLSAEVRYAAGLDLGMVAMQG